jgi:hypothetical protein
MGCAWLPFGETMSIADILEIRKHLSKNVTLASERTLDQADAETLRRRDGADHLPPPIAQAIAGLQNPSL